jgi:hypothetical protein
MQVFFDSQLISRSCINITHKGPLSEELVLLVLDTNILLHYFEVIQQFIADIEALSLSVMIIIPGAVIQELDGCAILFSAWSL